MPDYFFDTSVLVAYFGAEDTHSQELVDAVVDGDKTGAISALTVAELWASSQMEQSERKSERLAVLSLLDVVSIDAAIGERGGEFKTKDPHFGRLLQAGILKGEVY